MLQSISEGRSLACQCLTFQLPSCQGQFHASKYCSHFDSWVRQETAPVPMKLRLVPLQAQSCSDMVRIHAVSCRGPGTGRQAAFVLRSSRMNSCKPRLLRGSICHLKGRASGYTSSVTSSNPIHHIFGNNTLEDK